VYLVKDIIQLVSSGTKNEVEDFDAWQKSARRVLKIYRGTNEYNFFTREYNALSNLNKDAKLPGIVKMYQGVALRRPSDSSCCHNK
jgi:hypothetical protein